MLYIYMYTLYTYIEDIERYVGKYVYIYIYTYYLLMSTYTISKLVLVYL